jgi:transposase
MTVVLDLETGEILRAAEGRSAAAVVPSPRRLRAARVPLQAVAMANAAVDATRRDMYRDLQGLERRVIKATRFLLLKGGEKLDHSALLHLERLESLNQPLYRAHLLEEDLRRFWSMPSETDAERFLGAWIARALATRLRHIVSLAKPLRAQRGGFLACFRHPISTGPLEGLNSKIKVLKGQACGFRDFECLKLRLAFIHESTPTCAG